MKHYKSPTDKRTKVWSNSYKAVLLYRGKLDQKKKRSTISTTDKYIDGRGRQRFKGNKNLKESQTLSSKSY